jgi:phosphoribosylamine--glycine ligase
VRILVLGSGAREHAIVTALLRENAGHDITVAPGNAGIAREVSVVSLDTTSGELVARFAADNGIELVVIGPEAPLVAGVADRVRQVGIPVFGPGKAAAQLEGSKSFAKRIMQEAGVPTGRAVQAASITEVTAALDDYGAPYVVKADGLAAGKGVLVTDDRDAAVAHADYWLGHGGVLVEEFLSGQEVSLFLLSDGQDVLPLSPAQDFKRLQDGDRGPNTGGMGAYSPLPWLPDGFVDDVIDTVALPTVRRLAAEGTPFVGLLYCGLVLTPAGIRVIEFNARFGDPETEALLPRLQSDLLEILLACANGTLDQADVRWSDDASITVMLASGGYPGAYDTGKPISGLDQLDDNVIVFHAGTRVDNGQLVTNGGRVLAVTTTAPTFAAARARAYANIERVSFEGMQYRRDIGAAEAVRA